MTEVDQSSFILHREERRIVKGFETSASSAAYARECLGIPRDVRGLVIVDLAAGASSLTADLLDNGADAYALDWIYRDLGFVKRKIEDALEAVLQSELKEPYRGAPQGTSKDSNRFLESFQKHRERYRQGWLTQLPFQDNFSDWTVSLYGIDGLGKNFNVLVQAAREAIRITKPGGKVVIAPFYTQGRWRSAHVSLKDYIIHHNLGRVELVQLRGAHRLVITKFP